MQILQDGVRHAVVKSIAGETIDVSTLSGAPARVTIEKIIFSSGAATGVQVAWDATVDEVIMPCIGAQELCFKDFGGIKANPEPAGFTGDIVTAGTGAFTIILYLRKE